MNEQTRYRVTGSLFLFALAVVVLPMLFDGDGLPPVDVPEMPRIADVEVPEVALAAAAREALADQSFDAEAQRQRQRFDGEGFNRQTGTRHGEPELRPVRDGDDLFAVQLGAFADADNALSLRDRARADGFEAFTAAVNRSGIRQTRVAIGPFVDRARAEAARTTLSNRYGLEARLMAFSASASEDNRANP